MVKNINLSVRRDDPMNDLKSLFHHVLPDFNSANLICEQITGGNTNTLFRCHVEGDDEDTIVVRIYGNNTEQYIDREQEVTYMELLHQHGRGPRVYCKFNNGLVYGYVRGLATTVAMIRRPYYAKLIAEEFAELHLVPLTGNKESEMFPMLRKYVDLLPESFNAPERRDLYARYPSKAKMANDVKFIEDKVKSYDCPVVLCHNDLNYSNAIYDDRSETVRFIDYEYTFPNYRAFDIANHFCEYAGIETYDSRAYPRKTDQLRWIESYLTRLHRLQGKEAPRESHILEIYEQVRVFAMLSDMIWSMWAVVQARNAEGNLDFLEYAVRRMEESYVSKWNEVFGQENVA